MNEWITQDTSAGRFDEAASLIAAQHGPDNRTKLQLYRLEATKAQIAAQRDPTEANIFSYGAALEKLDYPSAEEIFSYGVRQYPRSSALRMGLASTLLAEAQYVDGIRTLMEAYRLSLGDPRPLELLGQFQYVPTALYAEVRKTFAESTRRFPHNGRVAYGYCMISFDRWNTPDRWASLPQAIPGFEACMRSVLKKDSSLPSAYFQLGMALQAKGEYDAAVAMLEKAVILRPKRRLYAYRLAFCYKSAGDAAAFRRELERFEALQAAPEP